MLTIREIAKKTGLSTATVSRALDSRFAGKVKESTRKRIMTVCDRGNYRPSITGRSFSMKKTYKVGMIFGSIERDLGNPLCGLFMRGVCDELQKAGYTSIVLHAAPPQDRGVIDLLRSQVADAYILGTSMISEPVLDSALRSDTPVISLGSVGQNCDLTGVRRDLEPAYRDIWSRIPASWSGKIAFCQARMSMADDKFSVLRRTAPAGFRCDRIALEFPCLDFCFDRFSARTAAMSMLDRLAGYKLLWCGSDLTALGIKDALETAGLTVGRDIFLIGNDDLENLAGGTAMHPFLSTVDEHMEEYGRLAAAQAVNCIGRTADEPVILKADYIVRDSFPYAPRKPVPVNEFNSGCHRKKYQKC